MLRKTLVLLVVALGLLWGQSASAVYDPNNPDHIFLPHGSILAESNSVLSLVEWCVEAWLGPEWEAQKSGTTQDGLRHYHQEYANFMCTSNAVGWTSGQSVWLELTLPAAYEMQSLLIWNHGQDFNAATMLRGIRWCTIEYSPDGQTWNVLGDYELNNAPETAVEDPYLYTDDIDMSGLVAQKIRITAFPPDQGGTFVENPTNDPAVSVYYGLAQVGVVYTGIAPAPPYSPTQDVLTRDHITTTASGQIDTNPEGGAAVCITNRTGILNPRTFEHEANPYAGGMWTSSAGGGGYGNPNPGTMAGPAWVRFDFDDVYNLGVLDIVNCKQENNVGRGLKKVFVEYSTDGSTWQTLMNGADDFFVLNPGTAINGGPESSIDFGGVAAQSVVITADPNGDGNYGDATYYSLSEVRFGLDGTVWPPAPDYPAEDIIQGGDITVTASNLSGGQLFWLVDNLGLGTNFRHYAHEFAYTMLLLQQPESGTVAAVPGQTANGIGWVRCDFGQAYSLGTMRLWNLNQIGYGIPWDFTTRGMRAITVHYTSDGVNWTQLGTYELPRAQADDQARADLAIDFGGVTAQGVVITATTNWGDADFVGLAEVEFGIAGTTFGYDDGDLAGFTGNWLASGIVADECTQAVSWDLNGDCFVNLVDYQVFATRWMLP